ncbi:hypothetical protein TA3x_000642 [Tundrisphaera sp. TA3]|uniref:hypothetical protein n=1 Tax=Tundrisphaera sp. TA3 TaxID=3435775 RepID=UPI003EB6CABA
MIGGEDRFVPILGMAMGVIQMALIAFAIWVCLTYRSVSRSMNLAVVGLVGMLAASAWSFVFPPEPGDLGVAALLVVLPTLMRPIAWGVFIVGLAGMLRDVHARLSPAKDLIDDIP